MPQRIELFKVYPMDDESIFLAALGKDSDEERRSFLAGACGDDESLRREVESLLRAHGKLADESAFLHPMPPANAVPEHMPVGTEIGPYKLIEQIGQGGMGTVYMAEQKQPVRRTVALKVIKRGMDSEQVVARFEAERQALALMNHPNIAKVLDAGSTESGRPYFVMELVKGIPVTEYCNRHKFDVRQRLELFVTICQAVRHAHQKGVIHRDIKPSNVLVELHDVTAVPKVIDFGVAKATDQQLTERTLHTGLMQMIGTPTYMSPEQAQLSGLDVDTRSDVYSLGVLLYELMTGTTPFEGEKLRQAGFDEMRRIIREDEPPRPSERVTTMAAGATSTVSDGRQSDPYRLSRRLRGELDWILMKAIEKDRVRRYQSASSFASDVQRFLDDEPVVACPPSPGYRFRKFAIRNKAAFSTAILVLLALLLGIGGTSWQAVRATFAQQKASRAQTLEAAARSRAELALMESTSSNTRAQQSFELASDAVQRMIMQLSQDRLRRIPQISEVREELMLDAVELFSKLIEIDPSNSNAYLQRARAHYALLDGAAALRDFRKAIQIDPTNHQAHFAISELLNASADFQYRDYQSALEHITRAIELAPRSADYRLQRAFIVGLRFSYKDSLQYFQEAIDLAPQKAEIYITRADVATDNHRPHLAVPDLERAIQLGPDPGAPAIFGTERELNRLLGRALSLLGRTEEALASFARAEARDPYNLYVYLNRCELHLRTRNYAAALRDANALLSLAPDYPPIFIRRARAYFHLGRYAESLADITMAQELDPTAVYLLRSIPPQLIGTCPDRAFQQGILRLANATVATSDNPEFRIQRGMLLSHLATQSSARDDFNRAIEMKPSSARYRRTRGEFNAEHGRWTDAARDFDNAIELNPNDLRSRYLRALIGLGLDDRKAYRNACKEVLSRFPEADILASRYQAAWTCAVGPSAVDDFSAALRAAEWLVSTAPDLYHHRECLGALHYRAGRFEDALELLESNAAAPSAYTWYFRAMAHYELGQLDVAKEWLERAVQCTDTVFRDGVWNAEPVSWDRRLTLRLLRAEAEALIDNAEKTAAPKSVLKQSIGLTPISGAAFGANRPEARAQLPFNAEADSPDCAKSSLGTRTGGSHLRVEPRAAKERPVKDAVGGDLIETGDLCLLIGRLGVGTAAKYNNPCLLVVDEVTSPCRLRRILLP